MSEMLDVQVRPWVIAWSDDARKQLRKLSHTTQQAIISYLSDRIATADHPTDFGKPLSHQYQGLWSYRVGDARVICQIRQHELRVLILRVGHRKNVYV